MKNFKYKESPIFRFFTFLYSFELFFFHYCIFICPYNKSDIYPIELHSSNAPTGFKCFVRY